jgi:hypothetical protein
VTNRWIRLLLAILAMAAASAAAYRVVENEQRLAQHSSITTAAVSAADAARSSLDGLESTLHAYVAPGQGIDSWTSRASGLLDHLRTALLTLDGSTGVGGASLGEALDACDRLAASEQRAREYARDRQTLLASEVIFTEARDLLQDIRGQVEQSRQGIVTAADGREQQLRREQMFLIAGGGGVLALVMLLLVPTGGRVAIVATSEAPAELESPRVVLPEPLPVAAVAPEPRVDTDGLAAVCSDIAAIADSEQLTPLLDRARALLDARGVIVWLGAPDRGELHAVAASGYDARIVARIASIAQDSSNLTADAFRDNQVKTSAATSATAAALAVPLPAPGGPAGVFSAELSPGVALLDAQVSAAKVIAAQLGAVLGAVNVIAPGEAGGAPSAAAAQWSS